MDAPFMFRTGAPSNTGVTYAGFGFMATSAVQTVEALGATPVPFDCRISKLYVHSNNSPGAGASMTCTLMRNGVATSLEAVIADTNLAGADSTDFVDLTAGDIISIRFTPSTTVAPTTLGVVSVYAETTNAAGQILTTGATGSLPTGSVAYGHYMNDGLTSTNNAVIARVPTAGTIDAPVMHINSGPGTGKSYTAVLVVNGVDTSVTVVSGTAAGVTTGTGSVHVAAGDQVYWKVTPSGTPSAVRCHIAARWTPDTAGESIMATISGNALAAGASYLSPTGTAVVTSSEAGRGYWLGGDWTVRRLYGDLSAAPGGTAQYVVRLRANSAATTLVGTLGPTDVATSDLTDTDTAVSGGMLAILFQGSNTPASATGAAAFVMYRSTSNPVNAAAVAFSGDGAMGGAGTIQAALAAAGLSGGGVFAGAGAVKAKLPAATWLGGGNFTGAGDIAGGLAPYVHLHGPFDGAVQVLAGAGLPVYGTDDATITFPAGSGVVVWPTDDGSAS